MIGTLSGGEDDSKMLPNIEGVKVGGFSCGDSVCGHGIICYCCNGDNPPTNSCTYPDLQSCQRDCHPPKYPRKFLSWFCVIC